MARKISGPYADDETMEATRRIAEAQFDLNHVRNRRRLLITQFLVNPYFVPRHIRDYSFGACIWLSGLVSASCLSKSTRSKCISSRSYLPPSLPRAKKSL